MKQYAMGLVLVTMVASVGCQQPTYTGPSPGLGDPYPAPQNDPQITVLNRELQPWLAFQPARVLRTETETMAVNVPMRNATDEYYQLDYRFIFLDANGLELTPVMGWRHMPVQPRQMVRFDAKSLTADAVDYRLEVKWAK
ncbi:MAG: YcfL family protein [Planctomycetota bacterium]